MVRPSSPDLAQTSVQYVCLLGRDHRHQYNSGRDKFRLTAVLSGRRPGTWVVAAGEDAGSLGRGGALGPKCACVWCVGALRKTACLSNIGFCAQVLIVSPSRRVFDRRRHRVIAAVN